MGLRSLHSALFLEQAEGYVKVLEKSTYLLSSRKEVSEHGAGNTRQAETG